MTIKGLRRITVNELTRASQTAVDEYTLSQAKVIIDEVKSGGDAALRACIERYESRSPSQLLVERDALRAAFERLTVEVQTLLRRTAARIETFANAQKSCLSTLSTPILGGLAGHDVAPVASAACYAPGGRFPLPSSVLMTALTAKVAGVDRILVVTPSTADVMLGAAYIAGADAVLQSGGAHAIAAVAYGTDSVEAVDMIVGPGNRWVTAAKALVNGYVGIDMLAGPSELLVLADESACPDTIAADLLAQAEHDPDARPILVTSSETLAKRVNVAIESQLKHLSTAGTASQALKNGGTIVCENDREMVDIVNVIAPEHLELIGPKAESLATRLTNYGGLFIGSQSAEVLGDYGAGPNHTLPTGGTARFSGGLSVFNFLRIRTWMRIEDPRLAQPLVRDAEALAELEGLAAHARSARYRRQL